jgi:hypothetical protein
LLLPGPVEEPDHDAADELGDRQVKSIGFTLRESPESLGEFIDHRSNRRARWCVHRPAVNLDPNAVVA